MAGDRRHRQRIRCHERSTVGKYLTFSSGSFSTAFDLSIGYIAPRPSLVVENEQTGGGTRQSHLSRETKFSRANENREDSFIFPVLLPYEDRIGNRRQSLDPNRP